MQDLPNTPIVKISKIISGFFNPLTSLFLYFLYQSYDNYSFSEAVKVFLPIFLLVILPISIWLLWNVMTKRYSNFDVSNRNQRKSLYFFIEGALLVYIIYEYLRFGTIDYVMGFLLILLVAMQLSNYFIKSSMHTAFNIYVAALFFKHSVVLGFIWLGIGIVVGITRVILKRHTIKEVLMGASIAMTVSAFYLYFNGINYN